jgi:hypothetical protein
MYGDGGKKRGGEKRGEEIESEVITCSTPRSMPYIGDDWRHQA